MYKEIELKPTQIDAITKNYASKILYPINNGIELIISSVDKEYGNVLRYKEKGVKKVNLIDYEDFYLDWSPIQKGEKIIIENKERECIDIQIVKYEDLKIKDWKECETCLFDSKKFYNKILEDFNINKENNNYLFLIEFKD